MPSLKIEFIKVHSKKIKSINLIEIQVNRPSFKYKLEIESEELSCSYNHYTEIIPIYIISIQKFDLFLNFISNLF